MRLGKLADIEALKQMRLISDDVLNKKGDDLSREIKELNGPDVFYRNLEAPFKKLNIEKDVYKLWFTHK